MVRPDTPPSPRLCLHGEPRLHLAGERVVTLERRAAALLALAALEPGVTRMRAAALLWPDSDDPRRNLRQQLLRFRRAHGRDLLLGADTLALAPDLELQADAPGPLLGSLAFDDCEDFAAWLDARRRESQGQREASIRRRIVASEAAGDLDVALAAAQELLHLDSRDETHHRECMRLHYLAGNTAAGLAAYEALRRMLAGEFGSAPSDASERLAETLRSARGGAMVAADQAAIPLARPTTLPVTLRRPPRMAGRSAELAAIQRAWADGLAVWLEGEAGMGKSRLLAELLGHTTPALQGAGRPGDAGSTYAALARLLRPLLATLPVSLDATSRAALAQLGPAAPALPRASLAQVLPQGAMAAAVAALLDHAGVSTVALDDLHFADEATIDLLAGLAAQLPAAQGWARHWLFATRPAEVPAAGRALRGAMTELQRLSVVTLGPLQATAVAELVDSLALGGLHGGSLADALVQHTGGNPLFVLETIKQGLLDGSLARGLLPRPGQVSTLIEARLARLSEPALTLARVVAIAGVDFSIELAEAAIGVRAVQLASSWQELQDAQILRDEAFAHDLVSDAVLRGVPPVVAKRVHAQCAEWLSARGGDPARVARHWSAGGRPAEAALAFEQAAERASLASRANEEAELRRQASQAFNQSGQPERGFEALLGRVAALASAQLDDAAIQEAEALVAMARNEPQRLAALRARIDMMCQRGLYAEVLPLGQDALALARRIGARELEARIACPLAGALCDSGRAVEAHAMLLPLRDWVDTQGADDLRATYYGYGARALSGMGRLRDAVASYAVAVSYRERVGRRDYLGSTLFGLSVVLRNLGRPDQVHACTTRALDCMSDDPFDTADRLIAQVLHARDALEFNRFAEAITLLDELQPRLQSNGSAYWLRANEITRATLWLRLGQTARAMQELQTDTAGQPGMPPWMTAMRLMLGAEVAAAAGHHSATGPVDQACALVDTDTSRRPAMQVRAMRFGDAQAVLGLALTLAPVLRAQERMGVLLAMHVHQARAALGLGQPALAADSARLALALLAEGYAPDAMYLPEAHLVAWQSLQAAGSPAEAAAALAQGQDWVRAQALPQVPAPFLDSFLHRNAVNRALLAAAAP